MSRKLKLYDESALTYGYQGGDLLPILKDIELYRETESIEYRNLSCDMVDKMFIHNLANGIYNINSVRWSAIEVMLDNHIDCFGLIEAGEALSRKEAYVIQN